MAKYLVNSKSEQSAGWYSDGIAQVLLGQIGWAEAKAPAEEAATDPEPTGPVWLINNDVEETLAEYPGPIAHVLLNQGNGWAETDKRPPVPVEDEAALAADSSAVELGQPAAVAPTGVLPADNPNTGESADNEKE